MTLVVHPVTVNRRSNEPVTVTVPIYSSEPGVVDLTYSGPITGPSQVTIPGARQYRYGGNPAGQYAARLLSANQGQDRNPASWLIRLRPEDIAGEVACQSAGGANAFYSAPILTCARVDLNASMTCRINWQICSYFAWGAIGASFRCTYPLFASASATVNPSLYSPPGIEYGNAIDYALAAVQVVSAGALTRYMRGPSGSVLTHTIACNPTGTMGGTEVIFAQWPFEQFAKYSRAITAQEAADWLLHGTIPSDPQIAYLGGHEIDGPQRVYDSGPMGLHLGEHDMSQYPGTGFGAPVCAHRYIETSPVQPVAVEIEVEGAGNATITAKRTRVGVPSSRPDSERFEFATGTITLNTTAETVSIGPDVDCQVPSYPATIDLIVASNYDGNATVVSDDPAITPTSPVTIANGAVVCPCTVTGDVTAATLTVTGPGGDTDTASVTISEVPEPAETLEIGPDVTVAAATYPCVVDLMITSNTDGVVNLASDNANLEVDATATVTDGVVEIEALALADVTGAIITASRPSGASDTCTVTTVKDQWISVGPNQRTRLANARVLWPIRVRSSKDGAFTATAEPASGIIISGPFEITGGSCDFTAQPTQAGTWTLTVDQDGRTDSVTLEALAPAAAPVVRQYNMAATIDAFFEYVNRRYGLRPRFTPTSVQDARAEHSTDRSYSRYAQGSPAPGPVFSAVSLSYQVTIAYSSTAMAEQDLGMIREEAERYDWDVIGFQFSGQTMFEPVKMNPRLTITMNFDIIPQGR